MRGGSGRVGDLPGSVEGAPRCGVPRASRRARWRALSLLVVHALVALHVAHALTSGRTLSPLEPSEAGASLATGVIGAGLLFLVLTLVSTLVLGRFFCGWACHVVLYQDACAWLLGRLGLRPKPVRSRVLAWVPLLGALLMFGPPLLAGLRAGAWLGAPSLQLTSDSFYARFPGPWIGGITFLVCGGCLVWLLGAKGFCTYGCPYGALFALAERRARGRIRVSDACEGCGHCTAVCTSNVRVHEEVARFGMVVDPGCMRCMDCVDVCPKHALGFAFGTKRPRARAAAARRRDFSWPEELLLGAGFLVGLYAFRGLYGSVPFLLGIALAVIGALALVLLLRLARSPEMRLQHLALRRAGRLTGAGLAALACALLYVAFLVDSALVQSQTHAGERWLARASALPARSGVRESALEESAVHLERALALGLFDSVDLRSQLGQVDFHRGRLAEARVQLTRALELAPDLPSAHTYLAEIALASGELAAACEHAERLLALAPEDPYLPGLVTKLVRRAPADERVRALAARARR